MLRVLFVFFAMAAVGAAPGQAHRPPTSDAIILITLDGARTQEIFGGLDSRVLRRGDHSRPLQEHPFYRRFWAATPQERRQRLLPFFWGTLMRSHGSIAGNAALGSRVTVSNNHRISYPGYAELLLGRPHDDTIDSNEPRRMPYLTALEFLRHEGRFTREQVAVFASWGVFNAIAEHTQGALTVNAGSEEYESPNPAIKQESALQFSAPAPWRDMRYDGLTFRFAMDHLARYRPRVLYLALGETDEWSHEGRYDRLLQTYARTDRQLSELWTWLQSQPDYRGRTSILLTTDHGRGVTADDWQEHGHGVKGSEDVWMAFVSPSMARRGEWRDHEDLTASQAAATLIQWLGYDWTAFDKDIARPVSEEM